jgi:hypothetical protein
MIRDAYLDAAETAAGLLAAPEVAAGWTAPSALSGFTVGGLANHLASQLWSVPPVLTNPVDPDLEVVTLLDHYARVRWLGAGLDDEANVRILRTGEDAAADGPGGLLSRLETALGEVRAAVPAEPAGRTVTMLQYPWALTLEDFLVTRMMELAVHSDDLAVSVALGTPALPPAVLDPVLALLTHLSVRRHGPVPLLRALSRAERGPATVAAF